MASASGSASAVATASASSTPSAAPVTTPKVRELGPARASLPFIQWTVEHCALDTLDSTPYLRAWLRYPKPADHLRPTDPQPSDTPVILPKPGSPESAALAAETEKAWLGTPKSRVVDCSFKLLARECEHCKKQENNIIHYIAYLPAELFTEPEKVQSVLFLVPGGHGGRSRAFLRRIPGYNIWAKGSGGLDVKIRADTFYAENPDVGPSIIVSLETPGSQHSSGATEFLTFDMEHHLRTTFLPDAAPTMRIGVDGISSGAREIMKAAFAKPESFTTLALHCLSCGAIHPEKGLLAKRPELLAWAKKLAARREAGTFDLRMSIGSRDNQLPCNRLYWTLFEEAGLVKPEDAALFHVVPGALHDFNYLVQAFPIHFAWHLQHLGRVPPKPTP